MKDLILVISSKESKRVGTFIIEVYLCNNIVNKRGRYGGSVIEKSNINNIVKANNITDKELCYIKSYFKKKVKNISIYQYAIKPIDFKIFYEKLNKKEIFYYYNHKNELYTIREFKVLEEYIESEKDEYNLINNMNLIYRYNKFELYLYSDISDFTQIELLEIEPKAKIIFKNDSLEEGSLKFEYNGFEISSDSNLNIMSVNSKGIARNYSKENEYIKSLYSIGYRKSSKNEFNYYGKENEHDKRINLEKIGFEILFLISNHETNLIKPKINIVEKGYDWFGIEIYCEIDNRVYNLVDKIDLSSNKKYITIGTKLVEIPEKILNQYEKLTRSEEQEIILSKKNMWSFLEIAKESNFDLDKFTNYDKVELELTAEINKKIKPYQIQGVKWLKWLFINRIGGCLADDMGLGKTFQVIAMLSEKTIEAVVRKVLIIVPKSLISNWCREFETFSNEKDIVIYHGSNRKELLQSNHKIYITTYNTAANDVEYISNIDFDITIFDEIQYIKNFNTQTYKKILDLNTKLRLGLSGTPMENSRDEIWNILNILNPGMLENRVKFKKRYANEGNNNKLHFLLNPFLLRRTKEEVLKELPEKREIILYCDLDEEQRIVYESIREALKTEISVASVFNSSIILKGLLLLREACCHPKLLSNKINVSKSIESCKFEVLKLKVNDLYTLGEKVLIFSQFTEMLKIIEEWLIDSKMKYFYLDGNTKNRQEVVDNFQNSNNGIFLMSLKAGGVGLNLTSAQSVIIYDPWWNPFAEKQAADRVFRIGQKKDVAIYKMIATETIEEKILELQKDKREDFETVFSGISKEKNIDLKEIIKLL